MKGLRADVRVRRSTVRFSADAGDAKGVAYSIRGSAVGDTAAVKPGTGINGIALPLELKYLFPTMFDAIKKTVLAGVGAAVISKDKAEEAFAEFVHRGKVSAADARKMAHKLAQQGRAEFKTVSRDIEKQVKELVEVNDAVARARIAQLEARLAALEKKERPAARRRRSKPSAAADSSA